MTEDPIRVVIADDQEVIRDSFREYLDALPDIEVVAVAENGAELVRLVTEIPGIDVLIVDVRMPVLSGLEAVRSLSASHARPAVIVVTTFNVESYVEMAITYGAKGFLLKDCAPEELADAVREVHAGGVVLAESATAHVFSAIRPRAATDPAGTRLSKREREVLTLIGAGLTNGEIAEHLFVAESTVKTHVRALLVKLQCRDRVALVRVAVRGDQ